MIVYCCKKRRCY